MTIDIVSQPLDRLATEALIVPLLADVSPTRMEGFDQGLAELIEQMNRHGDWRGEPNQVMVFYTDAAGGRQTASGIKRIILVGMGPAAGWQYEKMRTALATAVSTLAQHRLEEATVYLPKQVTPATAKDLAAIIPLAAWQFDHYKTAQTPPPVRLERVGFFLAGTGRVDTAAYRQAVTEGLAIGQATNYVRDLTNHPANQMTPTHLARAARELADPATTTVDIYDRSQIANLRLGAFLAVAAGSDQEPQLIVIDYHPADRPVSTLPTIGLVGKGITFDSGGISIKPADNMDEMKMDMAGAATCLGVVAAVKALALPIHLVVVVPATENMPSGRAAKPGDIVTAYDGKTIEILNTDAEGRLVLADALAYLAKEYAPDAIIDVATLTGAAIIALGHEAAAVLGRGDQLLDRLQAASQRTGERIWQLPLWDEYREMMKSQIADLKNIGKGRQAGTITGAAFLDYFVPQDIPWAHLDIAGTAMLDEPRAYLPKGGSGWGVRLLVDLLEHWPRPQN